MTLLAASPPVETYTYEGWYVRAESRRKGTKHKHEGTGGRSKSSRHIAKSNRVHTGFLSGATSGTCAMPSMVFSYTHRKSLPRRRFAGRVKFGIQNQRRQDMDSLRGSLFGNSLHDLTGQSFGGDRKKKRGWSPVENFWKEVVSIQFRTFFNNLVQTRRRCICFI